MNIDQAVGASEVDGSEEAKALGADLGQAASEIEGAREGEKVAIGLDILIAEVGEGGGAATIEIEVVGDIRLVDDADGATDVGGESVLAYEEAKGGGGREAWDNIGGLSGEIVGGRSDGDAVREVGELANQAEAELLGDANGEVTAGVDDDSGTAEEAANGLGTRTGEGGCTDEDEAGGVGDALGGGGEGALADNGSAEIGVGAGESKGGRAFLDEVADAGDAAGEGGDGVGDDGDVAASKVDTGIGVALEVTEALIGVVEADGGLATALATEETNAGGVLKGVVVAGGEDKGVTILDNDLAEEEGLGGHDVGHASVGVAEVDLGDTTVTDILGGLEAELGQGGVADDGGTEGTGVVLHDAQAASAGEVDGAGAEALDIGDETSGAHLEDTHVIADGEEDEGTCSFLDEGTEGGAAAAGVLVEGADDGAGEVAVEALLLVDAKDVGLAGELDEVAATGAGDDDGGEAALAEEGLEITDALGAVDDEGSGLASGCVARLPVANRRVVASVESDVGAVGTRSEVDGESGEEGVTRSGIEDEPATGGNELAGKGGGVGNAKGVGAGLVEPATALEYAEGTFH